MLGYHFFQCPVSFCLDIIVLIEQPRLLLHNYKDLDPGSFGEVSFMILGVLLKAEMATHTKP